MRNSLIILILVITWLCSCGQRSNFITGKVAKNYDRQLSLIHDIEKAEATDIFTQTLHMRLLMEKG